MKHLKQQNEFSLRTQSEKVLTLRNQQELNTRLSIPAAGFKEAQQRDKKLKLELEDLFGPSNRQKC